MEWNVYIYDINKGKIKQWNIFNHARFCSGVDAIMSMHYTEEDKKFRIRSELMYYFWSKVEYELYLMSVAGADDEAGKKIDVYDQVMLNFDKFFEYIKMNYKKG